MRPYHSNICQVDPEPLAKSKKSKCRKLWDTLQEFEARAEASRVAKRAERQANYDALPNAVKNCHRWMHRAYWPALLSIIFFGGGGLEGWKLHGHMLTTSLTITWLMDVEMSPETRRDAIHGALRQLDRNSGVIGPLAIEDHSNEEGGTPEGDLGFAISGAGTGEIVAVRAGGPAADAGLKKGDLLVSMTREDSGTFSIDDPTVLSFITRRLTLGEKVEVTVLRGEAELVFDVKAGSTPIVWAYDVGNFDGIQQIALTQFGSGAAGQVADVIESAKQNFQVKGVLLDLRGNPGGLATEVSALAELFLPEGTEIQKESSRRGGERVEVTENAERFPEIEVVGVVQNHSSASASEGFAAIVKDLELGPVVGEVSYGKGSTQAYLTQPGLPGIKLTTARFTGPLGVKIDGIGVKPDVLPASEDGRVDDWDDLIAKTLKEMSEAVRTTTR